MKSLPTSPAHISPLCPKCQTALVLFDIFTFPTKPEEQVWTDEWVCPQCREGVHIDSPHVALILERAAALNAKIDAYTKGETE